MPDDRVWALFEAYQEARAFELAEFDRYLRVFSTSDTLNRPEVAPLPPEVVRHLSDLHTAAEDTYEA
jgi:hypothetical protein